MLEELVVNFRNNMSQFLNSGCIINGTLLELEEVEKMGYSEFSYQSRLYMPAKFYKYFPNKEFVLADGKTTNYSIIALKNNTVYMQSPNNFDDIYDSDIFVNFKEYERLRLIEYCHRCKINIKPTLNTIEIKNLFINEIGKSLNEHKNFEHIFFKQPNSEIEKLENELFYKSLLLEFQKTKKLNTAISLVLIEEYEVFIISLKNKFRVSCFATTPYSQLMWGGNYADCHKGFCLEYTVLPNDERYQDVYFNLFPMIYSKKRSDITTELVEVRTKNLSLEDLWNIYFHGALRKSIDWAFQNEWRLLLPLGNHCENYNMQFFPITKVFLGNRMQKNQRKEIIEICNDKNIPYVDVMKNPSYFEMQDNLNISNYKNGGKENEY